MGHLSMALNKSLNANVTRKNAFSPRKFFIIITSKIFKFQMLSKHEKLLNRLKEHDSYAEPVITQPQFTIYVNWGKSIFLPVFHELNSLDLICTMKDFKKDESYNGAK